MADCVEEGLDLLEIGLGVKVSKDPFLKKLLALLFT